MYMSKREQLRRISEWADELGIHRKAIQRAIAWGHLHARRLGVSDNSPYYLTREDIDTWLDSRTIRRRAW